MIFYLVGDENSFRVFILWRDMEKREFSGISFVPEK